MKHLAQRASLSLAVLVAGVGATACSSDAVSSMGGVVLETRATAPLAAANAQRYRESGAKPATGRSGSAVVSAEAFILPGGAVAVFATSARAAAPTVPAGAITRLQLKAFDASGRRLLTLNLAVSGNPVRAALPALPPGATVQLTAHVVGIDGRRTDVVTVTGIVPVFAPDLAVLAIGVPSLAIEGIPVIVSATVAELGGARGATGECVLYVDGVEADRAAGIWVDAGDQVACAFTRTFTAGTRLLRVAVERTQPLDVVPGNDATTASIEVLAPSAVQPANMVASGDVTDGQLVVADSFQSQWTDQNGLVVYEDDFGYSEQGRMQSVNLSAVVGVTVAFPLTGLRVALASGGRLLADRELTQFGAPSGGGASCAQAAGALAITACTYAAGFTAVSVVRYAGSVVYRSREYSRTWNGTGYDVYLWAWNDADPATPFLALGSDLSFSVQLLDGAALYAFGGSGALAPHQDTFGYPRTCDTTAVVSPPDVFDVRSCSSYLYAFTGISGSVSGSGLASQSAARLMP